MRHNLTDPAAELHTDLPDCGRDAPDRTHDRVSCRVEQVANLDDDAVERGSARALRRWLRRFDEELSRSQDLIEQLMTCRSFPTAADVPASMAGALPTEEGRRSISHQRGRSSSVSPTALPEQMPPFAARQWPGAMSNTISTGEPNRLELSGPGETMHAESETAWAICAKSMATGVHTLAATERPRPSALWVW